MHSLNVSVELDTLVVGPLFGLDQVHQKKDRIVLMELLISNGNDDDYFEECNSA